MRLLDFEFGDFVLLNPHTSCQKKRIEQQFFSFPDVRMFAFRHSLSSCVECVLLEMRNGFVKIAHKNLPRSTLVFIRVCGTKCILRLMRPREMCLFATKEFDMFFL